MNILILGSGGREHALVWKIAQSPLVTTVYCCPGNAGIANDAVCIPVPQGGFGNLIPFCREQAIELVVVGPEQPLVEGIVDSFRQNDIAVFGPTAQAAQLEGSKVFAKEFMKRHGIPTAPFQAFDRLDEAIDAIQSGQGPWVVKADGLAAGKGVVICHDADTAIETLRDMMEKKIFGDAGARVLIEDCLQGEEGSFIVISDGTNVVSMATSQDHKAVFDDDKGPNTGGMGAYSPAPVLEGDMTANVMDRVILPVIRGMAAEGNPFSGTLYAGLMIVNGEPQVLEFNVRFGDPETQPIMARLKSDLVPLLHGSASGDLSAVDVSWHDASALTVILAAKGYPGSYNKGIPISGLDVGKNRDDLVVFHAGTTLKDGATVTSGGRVLGVTALGTTLADAKRTAYEALDTVRFEGMYFRTDIGDKALSR